MEKNIYVENNELPRDIDTEESKLFTLRQNNSATANLMEIGNNLESDYPPLEVPVPYVPPNASIQGLNSIEVIVQNLPHNDTIGESKLEDTSEFRFHSSGGNIKQIFKGASGLQYLRYGDRIKLIVQKNSIDFRLFSDGFATRRVFLCHGTNSSPADEIFRVIPRSDCAQLMNLRRELKILMKNNEKTANKGYRRLIEEEAELTFGRNKEYFGKPVRYYDQIQFIHEETQQYLSVSSNISLSEQKLEEGKVKGELNMLIKEGIYKDIMRGYSLKLKSSTNTSTQIGRAHV